MELNSIIIMFFFSSFQWGENNDVYDPDDHLYSITDDND